MEPRDVSTVSVLGAGTMGRGIAQVAALGGYDVRLRDVTEDLVNAGYEAIERRLDGAVQRDHLTRREADAAFARIEPVVDLERAVAGADLVIEAVPERMDVKRSVYGDLAPHLSERAVIATNTSGLSITALADASGRPDRFVGMHFFNPADRMRLVEIVRGEETSDETVEVTRAVAHAMDKEPVVVRTDSPGFVVNRVLLPFLNEAAWAVERGETTVDRAAATGTQTLGLPMGPFELLDFIGIDVVVDVLTYMQAELGGAYEPCPSLERKVERGELGRKSGSGFYAADAEIEGDGEPDEELAVRLVAVMANEVTKLVAADVAPLDDVDRAMKLGAGFPSGPSEMAEEYGTAQLVDTLQQWHDRTGDARYEPSAALATLAERDAPLGALDATAD